MQWHHRGEQLREQKDLEEACRAYRQALVLNPSFSWSHHSLGNLMLEMGDCPQAVSSFEQAIELNPDFAWSHYSLGIALAEQGKWEAALNAYKQARTLEPEMEPVGAKIVESLEQLIRKNPREVSLYREVAEERIRLGKFEEAVASLQMALQVNPSDQITAFILVQLVGQTDAAQAEALINRAAEAVMVDELKLNDINQLLDLSFVQHVLGMTSLFDPEYYRSANEVDSSVETDLLTHYVTTGAARGYRPNPLFDADYYLQQAIEAAELGINPLAHYYLFGRVNGHDPHPFFSHQYYLSEHVDVAATEICPLEHYLAFGAKEGRVAFSAEQFQHLLYEPTPPDAAYLAGLQGKGRNRLFESVSVSQTFGVYCSSIGNYFIAEIADFIAASLERAGHRVIRLSERDDPPDHLDRHVVVAPHEFFYLGDGVQRASHMERWAGAMMVNVEQPQTTWFSKAFHFLCQAELILDINVKSAAILQDLGLPVQWLPLGYLEDYKPFIGSEALPDLLAVRSLSPQVRQKRPALDAPLSERPIDIHFVGTLNPRREQFFASAASWLHQYRCFLHIPNQGIPLIKGQGQALDTDSVIGLSRRSKILLNIHRDELPYFEWHRIVFHGLWQNTLVVTEPCHDVPGLEPNVHFIACSLDEMEERIEWLLYSSEGIESAEKIRRAGHQALKQENIANFIINQSVLC